MKNNAVWKLQGHCLLGKIIDRHIGKLWTLVKQNNSELRTTPICVCVCANLCLCSASLGLQKTDPLISERQFKALKNCIHSRDRWFPTILSRSKSSPNRGNEEDWNSKNLRINHWNRQRLKYICYMLWIWSTANVPDMIPIIIVQLSTISGGCSAIPATSQVKKNKSGGCFSIQSEGRTVHSEVVRRHS